LRTLLDSAGYYLLMRSLPPAARHQLCQVD
jgi:hypothetical protein